MAGDWIKMRIDIADDPAVIGIAAALRMSEDEVVGKLHRLWSWADKHTTDGFVPHINLIDEAANLQGFASAMADHGLTSIHGGAATINQIVNGKAIYTIVRARIRPGTPEWSKIRTRIFTRDDYTCQYCGARGGRLECDHITPVSRGGTNDDNNLCAACFSCNRSKRAKTVEEWRAS